MRTLSPEGHKLIRKFERCKLKAYKNFPGEPWTIGWGNTYYEDGSKVQQGDVITQDRADMLFNLVVKKFIKKVDELVTSVVSTSQFDSLVSFAYNCGTGALAKSTLLKKVNADPSDPSIRNEFMKWNKVNKQPVDGLTFRRTLEADHYFKTM
jgi:lysozyme